MEFIPYNESFLETCLKLFRSNVPNYFTVDEEAEFVEFLLNDEHPYWVVKSNKTIVGCGGIYVSSPSFMRSDFDKEVGFAWGMIHKTYHGKGFGKALAKHRINYLKNNYPERPIVLRTTQNTFRFFEKYGFAIHNIEPNGFGDNMDKITMVYKN